jgi:hypothetical protein
MNGSMRLGCRTSGAKAHLSAALFGTTKVVPRHKTNFETRLEKCYLSAEGDFGNIDPAAFSP